MSLEQAAVAVRAAAERVFGTRVDQAAGYVELLERHGVERGLIGPREVERLWERHVLNSAVIGEPMLKQSPRPTLGPPIPLRPRR